MCTNFRSTSRSEKLRTNFRNFGRETCREREMNFRGKFREIGSWRTCTWRMQTTKMCKFVRKFVHIFARLSRNFVRIFVVQNLFDHDAYLYTVKCGESAHHPDPLVVMLRVRGGCACPDRRSYNMNSQGCRETSFEFSLCRTSLIMMHTCIQSSAGRAPTTQTPLWSWLGCGADVHVLTVGHTT